MSVFDWSKAVIEKKLFEGGDVTKPTEFVKDQVKFHSLNKLSGRFFNPVGLIASISDSENPFLNQLLSTAVSDIVQAGAFETTDGLTFNRTADNNSQDLFFDSAQDFKDATEGGRKHFIESVTRKAVNGLINRVGQALGIEVSGTRSIMGQVIAHDASLIAGKMKGSETQLQSFYESAQPFKSEGNVKLEPIGDRALTYTHDVLSFTGRIQEMVKLRRKITDGYFAQNVAVKKPNDVYDQERQNKEKKKRGIERALLKVRGIRNIISLFNRSMDETSDYWVNRMVAYEPFLKDEYIASGQKKLNRDFLNIYRHILANKLNADVDQFDSIPNNDYMDMFRALIYHEIQEYYDFDGDESPFLDMQETRLEKLKDKQTYKIRTESTSVTPIYTNISKRYKIGSDELKSSNSFGTPHDLIKDERVLDNLSESDIIDGVNAFAEDQQVGDGDAKDHVFFALQDVRNNKIMFLQPSIDNITEDVQPTYSDVFYLGRTESLPSYERTTRSINFSFNLSARTPRELLIIYKKMEFIQKLTYPKIENQFRRSVTPLCRLSIGDFYRNVGGYITTFTKSIDNSSSMWESQAGYRVPKIISCSLSMIVLHDTMPYVGQDDNFVDNIFIHGVADHQS